MIISEDGLSMEHPLQELLINKVSKKGEENKLEVMSPSREFNNPCRLKRFPCNNIQPYKFLFTDDKFNGRASDA